MPGIALFSDFFLSTQEVMPYLWCSQDSRIRKVELGTTEKWYLVVGTGFE